MTKLTSDDLANRTATSEQFENIGPHWGWGYEHGAPVMGVGLAIAASSFLIVEDRLTAVLVFVAGLIVMGLGIGYAKLVNASTKIELSGDVVRVTWGILTRKIDNHRIQVVIDADMRANPLQRLCGAGTLLLKLIDRRGLAVVPWVIDPVAVKDKILRKAMSFRTLGIPAGGGESSAGIR